MATPEACNQIVDNLFKVLVDGYKHDYIGEKISQLDHCLQAAAQAVDAGADDETVLGALLHDIGQFPIEKEQKRIMCDASALAELDPSAVEKGGEKQSISVGVTGHERIGGQYLRRLGFSDKVAQLVEAHVAVKRYLTGKDATYYDGLSAASKMSLKYQGGPFTPEQVKEFEQDPLFKLKVQVRQWDDAAKVVGLKVPDLESYRDMAVNHLLQQSAAVKAA
ncbi:hypothetical protein O0I10_002931 [Lichtheimia ornata]|uniref:HD domain-containing protein n=1 Tax=Lichtheimia ornata TaxID=688661 RepID=A0AAD7V9N6_9FUNG|nr:uncharacterized protein O0I10_002931 [Lichtheimia ornata]KAJ8661183.1 hypothetical protein O0I10_002931 [Lichtheimia ornata]